MPRNAWRKSCQKPVIASPQFESGINVFGTGAQFGPLRQVLQRSESSGVKGCAKPRQTKIACIGQMCGENVSLAGLTIPLSNITKAQSFSLRLCVKPIYEVCQCNPPETWSNSPVTQALSDDARNATVGAISCGWPMRPSGVCEIACFSKSLSGIPNAR